MRTTYSWRQKKHQHPNRKLLNRLLKKAVELSSLEAQEKTDGGINFMFVGDAAMTRINWDFLGHEGTTDVISFDYRDESPEIPGEKENTFAEIVVCVDQAVREAEKRACLFADELVLYIVHGILHIAGEDDLNPAAKRIMRRRERELLDGLREDFVFADIFKG